MAPSGGPQAIDMQPSAEAVPIRPVMAEPIEVHMLGLGVVGIVRDQHAAKLAKRVLFLSQVLVGIQLVLAVVAIVRNHGILFVLVGLFFNLIHPTYGMAQAAADAIVACTFIVDATQAETYRRRVASGCIAGYYAVQGVVHLAVFHWGNKLYNNRNYIEGGRRQITPVGRRPPPAEPFPVATAFPVDEVAAVLVPDTPRGDDGALSDAPSDAPSAHVGSRTLDDDLEAAPVHRSVVGADDARDAGAERGPVDGLGERQARLRAAK
ncbi:hypothetical protein JL720_16905 [Aureococcus anophagefferens]|nr:hypothetical protein JL720_16905 [Aureococcus anophagefferens]